MKSQVQICKKFYFLNYRKMGDFNKPHRNEDFKIYLNTVI